MATNGTPAGAGKSGYSFTAIPVTPAGLAFPIEFETEAVVITNQTGTKSFCATEDGVVRTNAPGVLAGAGGHDPCQLFGPMSN